MVRLFLFALAWPVGLVILLSVYTWEREHYPSPPPERHSLERIHYPMAHRAAAAALARFSALTPAEQHAVVSSLRRSIVPLRTWMDRLATAQYRVLCLGEFHEPATRRFLARSFFRHYPVDSLLLEATPAELERMRSRVIAGRLYVPLLQADIGAILRTLDERRPGARVYGIEETASQLRTRQDGEGSRDRSIARNFWDRFRPGVRHVILFGALHCTDEYGWLFHHLQEQSPPREALQMLNVQVIGEHQHGPLEAFVYFLDELGAASGDFVVADPQSLHPLIRDWFGIVNQQFFSRFGAMVVYRGAGGGPGQTITERRDGSAVVGDTPKRRARPALHPGA